MARRKAVGSIAKESLAEAAVDVLQKHDLTDWTVDSVAARAGCAKGLVLYHFNSKEALLLRATERVRESQAVRRIEAFRGQKGTTALDRLWEVLLADVRSGAFGLWVTLIGHSRTRKAAARAEADNQGLIEGVALSFGIPGDSAALGLVPSALDGFGLELLQGRPPADVRERYDGFWLGVLSAGT